MTSKQLLNEFMDTHPRVCSQWPLKNRNAMRHLCDNPQIEAFFDAFLQYFSLKLKDGSEMPPKRILTKKIECPGCTVSLDIPLEAPLVICPICEAVIEQSGEGNLSLLKPSQKIITGEVLQEIKNLEAQAKHQGDKDAGSKEEKTT